MENLDANTLVLAAALVVGAALIVLAVLRGQRGQAQLAGRLAQMADSQAAAQDRVAEGLRAQERALTRTLEERLADVGRRVGASLEKTSNQTQETMAALRERLARIDEAQRNITELSTQVVSLQDILANKQARGAFGEIQLKDLVSAVLPPSAYEWQAQLGNGKRVDCLLKLPNPPGPIGIDAKFPLESYHALRNAENDVEKAKASRQFSAAILKHVSDIKDKYIVPGETAEAALMFLPSEAVYAELHANFPQVVERSFRERVFIVSPTTLWATLNTVRAIFKDVRMREQAHLVQKELYVMLDDIGRLDDRVGRLQRHFEQAGEDMRQIRISTDKVTRRAGRVQELELDEEETTASLEPVPDRRIGGS